MKRALTWAALVLAATGVIAWLSHYLSTGTIIITANKTDTITLQKVSQGKPYVKVGLGSLSAAVGHGQYFATVKNGSQTSVQVLVFKQGHKTFRYGLGTSGLKAVEPVTYQGSVDIIASDADLRFRDATSSYLYQVDAQNNVSVLNTKKALQRVQWANPSFGVGQDSNGHLYAVDGSSITPLKVPFPYDSARVNFAAAHNNRVYISHGADVYDRDPNGSIKKIYTTGSTSPALAAAPDRVVVADETEEQYASSSKPMLTVIDVSGKVLRKNINAGELTWSPNGQYLISRGQSASTIYDSDLHQIATTPASSIVGAVGWLDDNTFFYASGGELWSYDVAGGRATHLASMPVGESIAGVTISSDKSYVYLTTFDGSSTYAIKRIGLRAQPVAPVLSQTEGLFPMRLADCTVNIVNFAGPVAAIVAPFPDSSLSSQVYAQEAQAGLARVGIDPGAFQFKVTSVGSGG